MQSVSKPLLALSALALLWGGLCVPVGAAEEAKAAAAPQTPTEQGKQIAFDRVKGNCLACHKIAAGESPGNIGPPLMDIKARYPDKAKLRAQIFDARIANPHTVMPPFGQHGMLTEEEVDKVVEFIYGL